jgi:hypothetical protein
MKIKFATGVLIGVQPVTLDVIFKTKQGWLKRLQWGQIKPTF